MNRTACLLPSGSSQYSWESVSGCRTTSGLWDHRGLVRGSGGLPDREDCPEEGYQARLQSHGSKPVEFQAPVL